MLTTINWNGENRTAIVLSKHDNKADAADFADALLDMLFAAFSSDEVKALCPSCSLYMTLQLYKRITETEKGGES